MSDDQLALSPSPERWPIWATVAHTAAARGYWLSGVLSEPGAERTPWPDPLRWDSDGWEDHLDHPRSAAELVMALETTWAIIDHCLDSWTPKMLEDKVERIYGDQRQVHTRSSIIQRLFTHEAYHCGELSQTLGIAGLPQVDLWRAD